MAKTHDAPKPEEGGEQEQENSTPENITAVDFSLAHNFSELDKRTVQMLYKDELKNSEEWNEILSKDFNFNNK